MESNRAPNARSESRRSARSIVTGMNGRENRRRTSPAASVSTNSYRRALPLMIVPAGDEVQTGTAAKGT